MSWLKDLLHRRQRLVVVVSLGFVLGALAGGGLSWAEGIQWRDAAAAPIQVDPGNLPGGPSFHIRQTTALALLQTLPVKGRAPKNVYKRDQFGLAWTDVDRNGCDTRNDILRRDLIEVALGRNSLCLVSNGVLQDPYTGKRIEFHRGADSSSAVQIDHIVALGDAWQKGAQGLSPQRRLALANDPLNLLAVDGPENVKKSDGDAATWLPPNTGFRCEYVARQVSVKAAYELWITDAEKQSMERVLASCPWQASQSSAL